MSDTNFDPRLPASTEGERSRAVSDRVRTGYGDSSYPTAPIGGETRNGFDFRSLLRVILKRKGLIAAVTAGSMLIGVLWLLLITPVYTATVRLQVDPEAKILEKGSISGGESGDLDYLRTQLELLQSRNIAERVAAISNLSWGPEPEASSGLSLSMLLGSKSKTSQPAAVPQRTDVGVDSILRGRTVKLIPSSRLIDIGFSDPSPQRAQRVANAFGDAFINFNLDKRLESNAYAKTFLDDQIKQLKIRLQDAEKAMLDFAQKEKLIASSDKDSTTANFEQIRVALGAATAERIKNELQWKQVEAANAINLPQLLTNNAISQLRAARNTLMAEYQEKSSTYGPNYPAMAELKSKIAEIDRQLATEVKTIKASFKAAYEASVSQEQELKKQVESTRNETLDTQRRSIQYNILKREVDTTRALYESLLQRFKEVDVASGVGVNNVFVVDKAELPTSPSYPIRSKFLALSLIGGLFAGIGLAYLLEWLDDVIHSTEEAEELSNLPILGIIPKVRKLEEEATDPRSGLSEAYRSLCVTLQLSTAEGLPKALCITSSGPGEGKSFTCIMIAQHFAAMGLRTLLIDADLRAASLHKKLGLDGSLGLTNYLTSGCTPSEAIQKVGDKQPFFFMASGPLPPNSAELLGSLRMEYLIDVTTRAFDLVVIDAPPVMGLADALLLTKSVNATIFVVAAGQTRKYGLQAALKRLMLARTNVIGLIMSKFDAKVAGYGYGGGGYGYGYGYGDRSYGQIPHQVSEPPRDEPEEGFVAPATADPMDFMREERAPDDSKPTWLEKIASLKSRFGSG